MEKEFEEIKSLDDENLIELYHLVEKHLAFLSSSYIELEEQEND